MLDGLAGLHSFVLAVDSELRVAWLSDDLGIVLGGPAKSVGRSVSSLVEELWPDDVAAFGNQTRQFVAEMLATNKVSGALFDLRQDGTALPLEVSAFPVRDSDANEFVVCVADRHQTRESIEEKNEELEAYVRNVSHDLRSPLVSLLGFSRLFRDDYCEVLDETGLHFLDRIEQAGRHMEQLLHDMRELSRIEETPHCRVHVRLSEQDPSVAQVLDSVLTSDSAALSADQKLYAVIDSGRDPGFAETFPDAVRRGVQVVSPLTVLPTVRVLPLAQSRLVGSGTSSMSRLKSP